MRHSSIVALVVSALFPLVGCSTESSADEASVAAEAQLTSGRTYTFRGTFTNRREGERFWAYFGQGPYPVATSHEDVTPEVRHPVGVSQSFVALATDDETHSVVARVSTDHSVDVPLTRTGQELSGTLTLQPAPTTTEVTRVSVSLLEDGGSIVKWSQRTTTKHDKVWVPGAGGYRGASLIETVVTTTSFESGRFMRMNGSVPYRDPQGNLVWYTDHEGSPTIVLP